MHGPLVHAHVHVIVGRRSTISRGHQHEPVPLLTCAPVQALTTADAAEAAAAAARAEAAEAWWRSLLERIRRRDLKLIMRQFEANLLLFYHP